ncbi:MAG: hypothetical protein ABSH48_25860, partial [Verrucomicrobiota bacterium]
HAAAFALIGPIQPWMQITNGVVTADDVGGPMPIGSGYRWNLPLVTYGFDPSFLDYFGTNGVAAVEGAIQILNNLPPASQIVLSNYPYAALERSTDPATQTLLDLKTVTLSVLLEHLGLNDPIRSVYVITEWDSSLLNFGSLFLGVFEDTNYNDFIGTFNFYPPDLAPSPRINNDIFTGEIAYDATQIWVDLFLVDPLAPYVSAIASVRNNPYTQSYCSGLTYDDVGGLAYLLSTNNICYETLVPGVFGTGTSATNWVNGAWRPGVDKITLIPHPQDPQSGAFLAMTNYFTDTFVSNGLFQRQSMARAISQPDFLFTAGSLAASFWAEYTRTGTTNWINNATANGNLNGAGPGVIQPSVQINFSRLGREYVSDSESTENVAWDYSTQWGSFGGSTNAPISYPVSRGITNQSTLRMLLNEDSQPRFNWQITGAENAQFTLETSTNLSNWTALFTLTNNGTVSVYQDISPASPCRYYHLAPQ